MMRKCSLLMVLLILLLALLGCSRQEVPLAPRETQASGGRLICLADSEGAAQEIAQLYDVELVKFQNGVAVFSTEENLQEVIQRGVDNGWPELSPDHKATIS